MRTLTEDIKKIIEVEIRKGARKEALEILEKCSEHRYDEFLRYHNLGQPNICCLVLDSAKNNLVKNKIMVQKKDDSFGFEF